jgi:hypothetical protein
MATRNVQEFESRDVLGILVVMFLTMGIAVGLPLLIQAL